MYLTYQQARLKIVRTALTTLTRGEIIERIARLGTFKPEDEKRTTRGLAFMLAFRLLPPGPDKIVMSNHD